MYVIAQKPSFTQKVEFETTDETGKRAVGSIDFQCKRLTQTQIDALLARPGISDKVIVKEVATGWNDVKDEAGNAAEFNEATLGVVLDVPGMPALIAEAYFAGNKASARKN